MARWTLQLLVQSQASPRAAALAALSLAGALALVPIAARAQYTASTTVHSDVNASTAYSAPSGAVKDAASSSGAAVSATTQSSVVDNLLYTLTGADWSQATAAVSGGALHLSAASEAVSKSTQVCNGCLGSANAIGHASAAASFSDVAALSVAGLAPGTPVKATFLVNIDGGLQAHASGNLSGWQVATVNWTFWLNGVHYDANGGYGYRIWVDTGTLRDNSAASMPTSVLMQTTLVTGQSFDISMAASVSSQAVAQTTINYVPVGHVDESGGDATASFANTFAWGGLVGLADMSGQALDASQASITSAGGFDYTQAYVGAVPEPGTALLLSAGLLTLARRRAARPLA